MKKFFIGLFAGLVAIFGSIVSVGFKSSFVNFNDFKSVHNAFVIDDSSTLSFYLDNTLEYFSQEKDFDSLAYINENSNCTVIYYLDDGTTFEYNITSYIEEALSLGVYELVFNTNSNSNEFRFVKDESDYLSFVWRNNSTLWDGLGLSNDDSAVIGFTLNGLYSLDTTNLDYYESQINDIIGDLTSLPIPPSPPSNNFLDDITNTINGVIDWFVDLFNGLADIFVIYDSNGSFVGFSLWGNVLFIEVSIMLVVIVLRWVISLIRGI